MGATDTDNTPIFKTKEHPPTEDGNYLAWNCRDKEWRIKYWRQAERGWSFIPVDRGEIYTHWTYLPGEPT